MSRAGAGLDRSAGYIGLSLVELVSALRRSDLWQGREDTMMDVLMRHVRPGAEFVNPNDDRDCVTVVAVGDERLSVRGCDGRTVALPEKLFVRSYVPLQAFARTGTPWMPEQTAMACVLALEYLPSRRVWLYGDPRTGRVRLHWTVGASAGDVWIRWNGEASAA